MNTRKPEDDAVFQTIAGCTMVIAALAVTALISQLIAALPLLESVFPHAR